MTDVFWHYNMYTERIVGDSLTKIKWTGLFDVPDTHLTYSKWTFKVYKPNGSLFLSNINYDERTWEGEYECMMPINEYPYYNSVFDVVGNWKFTAKWDAITPNLGQIGYREQIVTVSLPPPDLCDWLIDNWNSTPPFTSITGVFELIDSYLYNTSPSGYDFIPNITELLGAIDYYLGIDGDANTGCDMIS